MAKVMVSLPDDLLASVDERATEEGTTRSGLVQAAIRDRLAFGHAQRRRAEALASLRRLFANTGSWNAEELIRAERER